MTSPKKAPVKKATPPTRGRLGRGGGGGKGPPSDYGPASDYYPRSDVSRTLLGAEQDIRFGTGGATNRTGGPPGRGGRQLVPVNPQLGRSTASRRANETARYDAQAGLERRTRMQHPPEPAARDYNAKSRRVHNVPSSAQQPSEIAKAVAGAIGGLEGVRRRFTLQNR